MNKQTIIKTGIAAAICFLLLVLLFFKLATRVPDELSPEEQVKAQISQILLPLLSKESFRVEVSQTRRDFRLERQSVAILIDELKTLPRDKLEQVDALLRAAIGHDVARGDILRITPVAFSMQANTFSLSNEQKLYSLEALILVALFILSALYMRRKNPPLPEQKSVELPTHKIASLSEQVISEPAKAAAILRVWLNETEQVHGR